MALLTLNSTSEVGENQQPCLLNIEADGLVVEGYGKLRWAGSTVSIEPEDSGCRIVIRGASSVESRFFVPAECFGGPQGAEDFASWLEAGVSGSGATIAAPAAV